MLREQFKLLQPKIVVCLGRIASQRMIRTDFSVTKEHGTFVQKNGVCSWAPSTPLPCSGRRRTNPPPLRILWLCGRRSTRCAGTHINKLTLSVIAVAMPPLPKERPWQKDEAHKNCQGSHFGGAGERSETERARPFPSIIFLHFCIP